jgi:hypothetical protein
MLSSALTNLMNYQKENASRLSFTALCLLATICLYAMQLIYEARIADYDLFARVAVGRLIFVNGSVPTKDPFSFLPTKDFWFDHEWLSGLVFYLTSELGGDRALLLLAIFSMVLTVALIQQSQKLLFENNLVSLAWLFLLLIPSIFLWVVVVRSHIFTFLFLALFLFAFNLYRKEGKPSVLLLLPLVMVFWANAHGGFVVGLGFSAIFALVSLVDAKLKPKWPVLSFFLCLLAPLINPYGSDFLSFVIGAATKNRATIGEWQRIDFFSTSHIVLYLVLLLLVLSKKQLMKNIPLEGKAFLVLSLLFGIKHQRLLPIFYFCAAVYAIPAGALLLRALAIPLKKLGAKEKLLITSARLAVMSLFVGALIWSIPSIFELRNVKLRYDKYPTAAMNWIRHHYSSGNILSHFNSGSYVLWRGYPRFKVAIDGRYEEVYEDETIFKAHRALNFKEDTQSKALENVNPDIIISCKRENGIPERTWKLVYQDDKCDVFSKMMPEKNISVFESREQMWDPLF